MSLPLLPAAAATTPRPEAALPEAAEPGMKAPVETGFALVLLEAEMPREIWRVSVRKIIQEVALGGVFFFFILVFIPIRDQTHVPFGNSYAVWHLAINPAPRNANRG